MIIALLAVAAGAPQTPARADSAAPADTARLATIEVSVTRATAATRRVPAAIGTLDSADLRAARLLAGPDEALGRIPGLFVANRSNPSLDQRLVIRGAGSRATFGVRGLKLLIDGIPQTLPDGQSQLSNLDLGTVDRVEVLRGSSSALYGNASGGVIAFTTGLPSAPLETSLRVAGGSFGTSRVSATTGGATGRFRLLASGSAYRSDGYRRHSASLTRQLNLAADAVLSPTWLARVRYFLADAPRAENPGALTAQELTRPDAAAPNNVLRGADKSLTQHQLGLTLSHADGSGNRFEATLFGVLRDLENPLARAPPGPGGPTIGTFSAIDRGVAGARLFAERRLGGSGARLGFGVDLQRMRDVRTNRRADAGVPDGALFADQTETVRELAPFVTLHLEPADRVTITGALRYDQLRFSVADRYLGDGADQTGGRTMDALSGSLGASLALGRWTVYAGWSSAFETPTTTELANQGGGVIGFNPNLGPQRAATIEAGLRRAGPVRLDAAIYRTRIRNAIVQVRERDGRAFFENAGRLAHEGIELGLEVEPTRWLRLLGAYTYSSSRFLEYRLRSGAATDTLDGNRVPGIPRHQARLTAIARLGPAYAEVEQQVVSSQAADDRNTVTVDGWGAGVTNLRLATRIRLGGPSGPGLAPFVALTNLFDRRYVGSVNVNGFGGRVFEPAPGRALIVGAELTWRRAGRGGALRSIHGTADLAGHRSPEPSPRVSATSSPSAPTYRRRPATVAGVR